MSHTAVEVTCYLDPELAAALKRRAAREERPISAEVRRLIKASLTDDRPAGTGRDVTTTAGQGRDVGQV